MRRFSPILFLLVVVMGYAAQNDHVTYLKESSPPISLPNAKIPFDDVLTGGAPTFEQLQKARSLGFKSVIDLRPISEQGEGKKESNRAETLHLRYISIPVNGKDGVTVENARRLKSYLDDPLNYPLIVHCSSGNRVGALFAMKAFHLDGKDVETSMSIGKAAGLAALEPVVRERLKK